MRRTIPVLILVLAACSPGTSGETTTSEAFSETTDAPDVARLPEDNPTTPPEETHTGNPTEVFGSTEFEGRTFAIDRRGPSIAPYRIVQLSQTGNWVPVEGLAFRYRPEITASDESVMIVSPGAHSSWAPYCRGAVLEVAVSDDGQTWRTSELDDVWDEFLKTDWTPGGDPPGQYSCMYGGGGDAIGPEGMLIVRRITICCVDPDQYPHFWFSDDGVVWDRVVLTHDMLWGDTSPSTWGSPVASTDGFIVQVERSRERGDNAVETWESPDGLYWRLVDGE
jgi:hypothetical protein